MFQHSELVLVKRIKGKGRGVFARVPIRKGMVIEKVPLMLVPASLIDGRLSHAQVDKFFFEWDRKRLAVALGFGSLYNHSYQPNARYQDGPGACLVYKAIRNIARGEEITINYNGAARRQRPMKFKVL
jgi:SET domain-containing protein